MGIAKPRSGHGVRKMLHSKDGLVCRWAGERASGLALIPSQPSLEKEGDWGTGEPSTTKPTTTTKPQAREGKGGTEAPLS